MDGAIRAIGWNAGVCLDSTGRRDRRRLEFADAGRLFFATTGGAAESVALDFRGGQARRRLISRRDRKGGPERGGDAANRGNFEWKHAKGANGAERSQSASAEGTGGNGKGQGGV